MRNWFDLLQQKLRLPWLAETADAVPFGLTGAARDDWRADELTRTGERQWCLRAHSNTGLEAEWKAMVFPDTRAVECWGRVSHSGSESVRGIRECLTLDTNLRLPQAFGQPWVRTINGVRFIPNYFPPHDFAVVDRQMLDSPQVFVPLSITGMWDGRSSGENLPCAIICDERQQHGLAFFLEWSALWRISFCQQPREYHEVREVSPLRVQIGLWGLNLHLKPGESLPLPRLLITVFDGDLEEGGNSLRRHIRRFVMPKLDGAEPVPPVYFNHWAAFGNEFSAEMLEPAVEACAEAGMEYFCVDAGWFEGGFRDGIGNWDQVDATKFPRGIAPFAEFVRAHGMRYGTWFEPEWAHQDSQLYREHPDWFLPTPREMPWYPHDYPLFDPTCHLMNFGLPAVQQWWYDRILRAYREWGMRWVRWDFNQMPRPNWEAGVPEGEIGWRQIRHVEGLYRTLDAIMRDCPDLFVEQCASGGHRIDLGTIRRGHSFWMNDLSTQTDIVRALQHGLNTVLPGIYANTNLCQNRHDFTDYDYLSHGAGALGYCGRLWEATREELACFAAAIRRFKQYRHLLMADYSRPTGQPSRADEYAEVVFRDAVSSARMEFNLPGKPRQAQITLHHVGEGPPVLTTRPSGSTS